MNNWYVLDESVTPAQPVGPYSYEQLQDLATQGRLQPSTRIARVGGAAWTEAGLEPALTGLFHSTPPQNPDFAVSAAATLPVGCPEFTFAGCVNQTLAAFQAHWTKLLVVAAMSFGGYMVLAVPQLIGGIYDSATDATEPSPVNLLGVCCSGILNIFVGLPFFYGCVYAATRAIRGALNPADVLIGFRNYGQMLLAALFMLAVYTGAAMVAYIPLVAAVFVSVFTSISGSAAPGGMQSVAFLVGVLLTIGLLVPLMALFVMRVLFLPLAAVDPALGSMGVARAISYSWSATKGCGWRMFGLLLGFSMLAAASLLLLCVGYLLIGMPMLMALMAVMYETIYRRGAAQPPAPAAVAS